MQIQTIQSGQRRDPLAVCLRGGLRLAAIPYGLAAGLRNRRYDRGRGVVRTDVPVISVGNLTTGGTGKTPLVCHIACRLRQAGVRVALISRGYGRGEAGLNDEALELEQRLPDVPHVQDPDRVAAARIAIDELGAQAIVMDDGFQHRRLHRDLDIVAVDATCPFGYGYLLPRGMLREPLDGIRRADLAVLTRSDAVSEQRRTEIRQRYQSLHPELRWMQTVHRPTRLVDQQGAARNLDQIAGSPVVAFCGIGNPEAFGDTIRRCGAHLLGMRPLPDHAVFDRAAIESLTQWVQSFPDAAQVLCTHKDLVKVRTGRLGGLPLAALQVDLQVQQGQQQLDDALQPLIARALRVD